ncbi:hypothetical protein [Aliiroseovarius sp. 2305UL8-7]|uniref:hypothetical protein n=1 Tax=Aliiroseovarius conchicola TaxID=3121637 RepID=UPI003528663A
MSRILKTTIIAAFLAPTIAFSDDISDTLESALAAYNEGDIQYALEELEYAKQLLQSMKTADLAKFLPEAPAGWTREVSTEMNAGLAMLGGGAGAEATYSNADGNFTITIMVDNPMIGALSGMLANAGVMGIKLERVGRMKYLNQDGELSGMVDGRILIQAKGASSEIMLPVLETIDQRELRKFGS